MELEVGRSTSMKFVFHRFSLWQSLDWDEYEASFSPLLFLLFRHVQFLDDTQYRFCAETSMYSLQYAANASFNPRSPAITQLILSPEVPLTQGRNTIVMIGCHKLIKTEPLAHSKHNWDCTCETLIWPSTGRRCFESPKLRRKPKTSKSVQTRSFLIPSFLFLSHPLTPSLRVSPSPWTSLNPQPFYVSF